MKNFLTEALHKYQDLDMELENWKFLPPYRPIAIHDAPERLALKQFSRSSRLES
jgi:hypothetical protein